MNPPPYSFAEAFSAWRFDVGAFAFIALLGVSYGWLVRRSSRAGARWPWWRTAAFVALGLGTLCVCTMSSLAVYQHAVPWAFSVQITLLMTVAPVALAAGDPIGLLRAGCGAEARLRLDRALGSKAARVLTFPLVAAVLGVVVQMLLFFGPFLAPALEHRGAMNLVYLASLSVGCLLAWPLLGEDLLPAWCTPPLRMLFAAVDGLLDAIPGIALAAAGTLIAGGYFARHRPPWSADALAEQHLAGGLAVAFSEVVAIPLLVMLFFQWARGEMRAGSAPPEVTRTDAGTTTREGAHEPELERPWWETDARFGRRTDEYRGRSGR